MSRGLMCLKLCGVKTLSSSEADEKFQTLQEEQPAENGVFGENSLQVK